MGNITIQVNLDIYVCVYVYYIYTFRFVKNYLRLFTITKKFTKNCHCN